MTKEEAWLVWMNATKTTDTPVETDFDVIKKSSWWAAFEAGWDAAAVNLNGWDQAYAMGRDLEKKEWVGLTDEQLHKIIRSGEYDSMEEFARAIEAKLKEKNT